MDDLRDHLRRLKASQETSTSTSASSVCTNLGSLSNLQELINDLIQMPSTQKTISKGGESIWINELLDGSLRLVDLCGFSRDAVCSTKRCVQELESSIRRSRCGDDHINAYTASVKKINTSVKKRLKKLKCSNQVNSGEENEVKMMLREAEVVGFSIVESVLVLLYGEKEMRSKQRRWSLLSRSSRVYAEVEQEDCVADLCSLNIHKLGKSRKQLSSLEMKIQEVDEGLESLYRSLIKTRVSLLNLLSH